MKAEPNRAHKLLASLSLSTSSFRSSASTFKIITQNVDGLSLAAAQAEINPTEALEAIIQMHGSILSTICLDCKNTEQNRNSPICEALGGQELSPESPVPLANIPLEDLPRCTRDGCGGLLRPGVVWFGETPMFIDEIYKLIYNTELCIVVGTSSTVRPRPLIMLDLVVLNFAPGVSRCWLRISCQREWGESSCLQSRKNTRRR